MEGRARLIELVQDVRTTWMKEMVGEIEEKA